MPENNDPLVHFEQQKPSSEALTTRSQAFVAYYTNNVAMMATNYDLRLLFSQLHPNVEGVVVNEQMCSVGMSYENAKALNYLLGRSIAEHEKQFGPVNIVPKGAPMKVEPPTEAKPE